MKRKRELIKDLLGVIKPLIQNGVLKIKKENDIYKIVKIEGAFDYTITRDILFNCLSIVRNHIEKIHNKGYLYSVFERRLLKEVREEAYLINILIIAFLKALSLTPAPNLNTKQLWQVETQFLVDCNSIIMQSANNLFQDINEGHVRTTILISLIALIISVLTFFIQRC